MFEFPPILSSFFQVRSVLDSILIDPAIGMLGVQISCRIGMSCMFFFRDEGIFRFDLRLQCESSLSFLNEEHANGLFYRFLCGPCKARNYGKLSP